MSKKKARIKTDAVAHWVPADREQANEAIASIGEITRKRERIEAAMNDELAKVKAKHEEAAKPLMDEQARLADGVKLYCEANRSALTEDGKVKSYRFAAGTVSWRTTPFSVVIRDADSVLATLKDQKQKAYIRTKEEIDRDALLRDRVKVETLGIAGIGFRQKEEFSIEPFEAKIDGAPL